MSDEKTLHNFSQFIQKQSDGSLNNELTEGMREMIAQLNNTVMEHGGKAKGKITLTVDVLLDQGVLEILTSTKIAMPKRPAQKSVYWTTEDHKLTLSNPRQPDLPFRTAGLDKQEARNVG